MSESQQQIKGDKNDIVEILKKKRVASEKQKKACLKASIIASQKRKADKIKLDMLKELEENKVDIHKILDETREKQQKLKKQKELQPEEPINHNKLRNNDFCQRQTEPIDIEMEPIRISLRDRLRNALL